MLFRYPGGKGKLSQRILLALGNCLKRNKDYEYREPFFGAGAIGWRLLSCVDLSSAWINDFDPAIYCVWRAVVEKPREICVAVEQFSPSIDAFYSFKENLRQLSALDVTDDNLVNIALQKIAIHQISYSGLGPMAGGPLGGKEQKSDYKIDCRWNPLNIRGETNRLSRLANRCSLKITCEDFETIIRARGKAVIYLDPPYYEKGPELYQHSFSDKNHERLMAVLKETDQPWLLSYDDCDRIRELYDFAVIEQVFLKYSINGSTDKPELLIAPKEHAYLLDRKGSRMINLTQ